MFIYLLILVLTQNMSLMLYNGLDQSDTNWKIVNDVVMGGESTSKIEYSELGFMEFSGHVSTKNNGGFASARLKISEPNINDATKLELYFKGDGGTYQLRLKSSIDQEYTYIQYFETNSEWQKITFLLEDFYPTYRGEKLDEPNFNDNKISEVGLLVGNDKEEDFSIKIKSIQVF